MEKLLFVTPEAHPLIKTGGLGDVSGSLPVALAAAGLDVRMLVPGYADAQRAAQALTPVGKISVPGLGTAIPLLEGTLPGTDLPVWLIDYPPAFGRAGHPYLDAHGQPWYDNAARFALLANVAVELAQGRAGLRWQPDIVHCNDWQTGLVPALLSLESRRPTTVFTIHNLAYQGTFDAAMFGALGLPPALWSMHGLEFYGELSFIKGGLAYADRLTTVSPTYAREIQTPEFGYGLDGLLRARSDRLHGILNGIDTDEWNPARDPILVKRYSAQRYGDKRANKLALQEAAGLPADPAVPLLGMVGRLVHQKGVDLVLDAWPALAAQPLQMVVLGSGERAYETGLREAAAQSPDKLAVNIGYDEALAHRIEAGADIFLMPSRFEPCGLNQMYSLRYGTVPIVRRVGGLVDTVVDAQPAALRTGHATGVMFDAATPAALMQAAGRALALYRNPRVWKKMALTGMRQDFSWKRSAREYVKLYALARTAALPSI